MEEPSVKRVVTSAIEGMSVKEVRRYLHAVRMQWVNSQNEPFFITNALPGDTVSIQRFALMFVTGQHRKRHNNTKPGKQVNKKTKT